MFHYFSITGLRISWKDVKAFKVYSTLSPDVTDDCFRYRICTKVSNYPTKIAEWALKQVHNVKIFNIYITYESFSFF